MRKKIQALLTLSAVLLVSCATTRFTADRGASVLQGKGGTVRTVAGIDIWEVGAPDGKYRILGVIEDTRGDGLVAVARLDSDLAKIARQSGGDAVVLATSDRETQTKQRGVTYHQKVKTYAVVKYLK